MAPNPDVNVVDSDEESDSLENEKESNGQGLVKKHSFNAVNCQNGTKSKKEYLCSSDELVDLRAKYNQRELERQNKRQAPPSALNDVPTKRRRKRVRKRKTKDSKSVGIVPVDTKASMSKQHAHLKPTVVWSNNAKNVHVRFSDATLSPESSSDDDLDDKPVKVCKFKEKAEVGPKKVQALILCWDPQTQSYQPEHETSPPVQASSTAEAIIEPSIIQSEHSVTSRPSFGLRLDIPPLTPTVVYGPNFPSSSTDNLSEAEVPSVAPVKTPITALPAGPSADTLEELRKEIEHLNLPVVDNAKLNISDTIAFKILRMDDQCQPTISDYIIGCIERVNTDRNELSIRLLAGKSEIGSRICTTVITEENEIGLIEEDHIDVMFKELYEPRYCLFST